MKNILNALFKSIKYMWENRSKKKIGFWGWIVIIFLIGWIFTIINPEEKKIEPIQPEKTKLEKFQELPVWYQSCVLNTNGSTKYCTCMSDYVKKRTDYTIWAKWMHGEELTDGDAREAAMKADYFCKGLLKK